MTSENEIELERQKEYIQSCRTYTAAFAVEHGQSPRACVVTFGCQMNARDSEKLAGILEEAGYQSIY